MATGETYTARAKRKQEHSLLLHVHTHTAREREKMWKPLRDKKSIPKTKTRARRRRRKRRRRKKRRTTFIRREIWREIKAFKLWEHPVYCYRFQRVSPADLCFFSTDINVHVFDILPSRWAKDQSGSICDRLLYKISRVDILMAVVKRRLWLWISLSHTHTKYKVTSKWRSIGSLK